MIVSPAALAAILHHGCMTRPLSPNALDELTCIIDWPAEQRAWWTRTSSLSPCARESPSLHARARVQSESKPTKDPGGYVFSFVFVQHGVTCITWVQITMFTDVRVWLQHSLKSVLATPRPRINTQSSPAKGCGQCTCRRRRKSTLWTCRSHNHNHRPPTPLIFCLQLTTEAL